MRTSQGKAVVVHFTIHFVGKAFLRDATMKTAVNVLERPGYDHWTPTYSMNTSTIKKHSVLQVEQMIQAKIAVQVPNIILGPLMT